MKKISLLTLTCYLTLLTACQTKQASLPKQVSQTTASTSASQSTASATSTASSSSQATSSHADTTPSKATETTSSSASEVSSSSSQVESVSQTTAETSADPSKASSSSQTEASSQTTSETSSAIDTQTNQTESQPQLPSNEELYATTLYLVATDTTPGRATHYAFFDVDGNGTAELITANSWGGQLSPAAIYYLQNGVSTYLARAYVADGGGRRETFTVYHDGTVEWDEWSSGNGQGTAYLYQLAPDNSGHWVIGQADFNQRELPNPEHINQFDLDRVALDLSQLAWQAF